MIATQIIIHRISITDLSHATQVYAVKCNDAMTGSHVIDGIKIIDTLNDGYSEQFDT